MTWRSAHRILATVSSLSRHGAGPFLGFPCDSSQELPDGHHKLRGLKPHTQRISRCLQIGSLGPLAATHGSALGSPRSLHGCLLQGALLAHGHQGPHPKATPGSTRDQNALTRGGYMEVKFCIPDLPGELL